MHANLFAIVTKRRKTRLLYAICADHHRLTFMLKPFCPALACGRHEPFNSIKDLLGAPPETLLAIWADSNFPSHKIFVLMTGWRITIQRKEVAERSVIMHSTESFR